MRSLSPQGRFWAATTLALSAGALVTGLTLSPAPSGLARGEPEKAVRLPWTTSRVVGSPDPPAPFKVVREPSRN